MKWMIIIISAFFTFLASNVFAEPDYGKVFFKDHCFSVELAKTAEERSLGLMFREYLDLDKGMLFIFEEEGRYSFWMKNTLILLDIIRINKDKKVVFINDDIQPCREESCVSIDPDVRAKYVLELSARA